VLFLFSLTTIAIYGFIDFLTDIWTIAIPTLDITFVISALSIMLGLGFYALSLQTKPIKRTIQLGIPFSLFSLLLFSYLLDEQHLFRDLFILLAQIGFILFICLIPLLATYALLKKNKNFFISAGIGLFSFFIYVKLLFGEARVPIEIGELVVAYFIVFLLFLELGTKTIDFSAIVQKMTPNEFIDETMVSRFNQVVNRYLSSVLMIYIICIGALVLILWYVNAILAGASAFSIDMDLGANYTFWVLVIIMILSAILFWYLIPREKKLVHSDGENAQ